ncbi:hypothetical protein IJI17_02155 [Candidatus Saccharibacteria bacterium]|nr:hypothetical protein [Achromobacter sp.]MBQ2649461.1 hypothetical protein [Achromobacter sp.]MBQ6321000.1 hypothetical protein [Candidatus Saccharibacteria bacterium]
MQPVANGQSIIYQTPGREWLAKVGYGWQNDKRELIKELLHKMGNMEQLQMFEVPKRQGNNAKRKWENAFQRWSDNHGMDSDNHESWGACGYGVMCDWCVDNSFGRPCVRALNAMCREKGKTIDYTQFDFVAVWLGLD